MANESTDDSEYTAMVVDDSPLTRHQLEQILNDDVFTVVATAEDGLEAVQEFREKRPDVVTMDVIMPNKDGIEALEEIMNIDTDTSVVMVTTVGTKEKVTKAVKIGADNYIVKPFDESDVLDKIKEVLQE